MQKPEYDVIVAGGGTAGAIAAIAAARNGANILLVERYGFLGGALTGQYVPTARSFLNTRGEQIIGGIPQEIVNRVAKLGGSYGHKRDRFWGACGSSTWLDPAILKYVLDEMSTEASVKLLFHSFITGAVAEKEVITGIAVESKSGRQILAGKIVIDATGDGDVAASAGAPYEKGGKDGRMMQVSLFIRVGNVQRDKMIEYIRKNPEDFMISEDPYLNMSRYEVASRMVDFSEAPEVGGFFSLVKAAVKKGEMHDFSPRKGVNLLISPIEGEVIAYGTNVVGVDATNAWDLSSAEVTLRRQAFILMDFLKKYVPGFKSAYLIDTATQVGVRETRRILGEYILSAEDVIGGRKFEDVIAKGSNPVDMHSEEDPTRVIHRFVKEGGSYDIPYTCLVPKRIENLLVVGRCISATREGIASARTEATCMAEGQAAGTAAALCVKEGTSPRKLHVKKLQDLLVNQGAILFGTH